MTRLQYLSTSALTVTPYIPTSTSSKKPIVLAVPSTVTLTVLLLLGSRSPLASLLWVSRHSSSFPSQICSYGSRCACATSNASRSGSPRGFAPSGTVFLIVASLLAQEQCRSLTTTGMVVSFLPLPKLLFCDEVDQALSCFAFF